MEKIFKESKLFIISLGAIPAVFFRWYIDQMVVVNIIGCFLLGFINALSIPKKYKLLFGFGFCGTLTTFSGWTLNLVELLNDRYYARFFLNSIFFVLVAIFAVGLGDLVAKKCKS